MIVARPAGLRNRCALGRGRDDRRERGKDQERTSLPQLAPASTSAPFGPEGRVWRARGLRAGSMAAQVGDEDVELAIDAAGTFVEEVHHRDASLPLVAREERRRHRPGHAAEWGGVDEERDALAGEVDGTPQAEQRLAADAERHVGLAGQHRFRDARLVAVGEQRSRRLPVSGLHVLHDAQPQPSSDAVEELLRRARRRPRPVGIQPGREEDPLGNRRRPRLAAGALDAADEILIAERIAAHVDLADDRHQRFGRRQARDAREVGAGAAHDRQQVLPGLPAPAPRPLASARRPRRHRQPSSRAVAPHTPGSPACRP